MTFIFKRSAAYLAPAITSLIRSEHGAVLALFHRLGPGAADAAHDGLVRTICAALELHLQLEREIFHPALRQAGLRPPLLDASTAGHERLRGLLAAVRALEGRRNAQREAVHALLAAVMQHVAEEETELLPAAERLLGPERGAELGARLAARRLELLVSPRAAVPLRPARAAASVPPARPLPGTPLASSAP